MRTGVSGFPGVAMMKQHRRGLKKKGMNSLPVPGGSSEIEGFQGRAPSGGSRGGSCLPLPASGAAEVPGLVAVSLVSASVVTWPVSVPPPLSETQSCCI